MNVITLQDTPETAITKMAEGNPGAISVMSMLLKKFNEDGLFAIIRLDDMQIRGWKIWVGFKDYCKQDLDLFYKLINSHDKDMLEFIKLESAHAGEYI
jgi:hypothetical protein